ncbi:hypothetical protein D3C81_1885090 [compost metagenome]
MFMAQGHVLVVGDEEDHLVQGDQLDAFPGACADMTSGTAPADRSRTGQRSELHTVRSLGLLQRLGQGFGAHRLDQVAHGADLEGLEGELVMGRAEDHRRWRLLLA